MRVGDVRFTDNKWHLYYTDYDNAQQIFLPKKLLLCPSDQEALKDKPSTFAFKSYFEVIDEFTHQKEYQGIGWGDGNKMAKLIKY